MTITSPIKRERSALSALPVGRTELVDLGLPVAALVVMIAIVGSINSNVFSYLGLDLVFSSAVPLVFAAIAQSFIISLGDIDLGVGYFVGLVNCVVAVTLTERPWLAVIILIGLFAGYAVQAVLIAYRKVPSIIVTLGASFLWLGFAQLVAPTPAGSAPKWLTGFFAYNPPLLPLGLWLIIFATIAAYLIFFRTKIGLLIRASGSNGDAFVSQGANRLKVKVAAYLLAALFALLAGLAVTGATASGDATASADYTLLTIAAVILGGASFKGGKVSALGVVVGALVLSLVGTVMAQLDIPSNYQTGVEGLILILAIAGRRFLNRRSAA